MKFPRIALVIISTCFLLPQVAPAQTTTLTGATNGLWNTGLSSSGNLLNGGAQDGNYSVIASPIGPSPAHRVNGLPVTWVANPATAQWISISSSAPAEPSGTYDYRLILSNIPINQLVTISGFIAADDQVSIFSNGSVSFTLNTLPSYANALTAFSFTFVSSATGTNTLDFNVLNTVNNSTEGLLVSGISGFYSPVPEPSTVACVALFGLGGLIVARRKRKQVISEQ